MLLLTWVLSISQKEISKKNKLLTYGPRGVVRPSLGHLCTVCRPVLVAWVIVIMVPVEVVCTCSKKKKKHTTSRAPPDAATAATVTATAATGDAAGAVADGHCGDGDGLVVCGGATQQSWVKKKPTLR
jgi:hypothetical protein